MSRGLLINPDLYYAERDRPPPRLFRTGYYSSEQEADIRRRGLGYPRVALPDLPGPALALTLTLRSNTAMQPFNPNLEVTLSGDAVTKGTTQVYQIFYNRPYNVSIRLRPAGDLLTAPVYATVTFYPALLKVSGEEKAFISFGPHAAQWLINYKEHRAFDVYIPTTDPKIVIYAGKLINKAPPGSKDWGWDIEESRDFLALLHGRPIADLGGALPSDDPFSGNAQPDKITWLDRPALVMRVGRALPTPLNPLPGVVAKPPDPVPVQVVRDPQGEVLGLLAEPDGLLNQGAPTVTGKRLPWSY